jgi:hypothetical protein
VAIAVLICIGDEEQKALSGIGLSSVIAKSSKRMTITRI